MSRWIVIHNNRSARQLVGSDAPDLVARTEDLLAIGRTRDGTSKRHTRRVGKGAICTATRPEDDGRHAVAGFRCWGGGFGLAGVLGGGGGWLAGGGFGGR